MGVMYFEPVAVVLNTIPQHQKFVFLFILAPANEKKKVAVAEYLNLIFYYNNKISAMLLP